MIVLLSVRPGTLESTMTEDLSPAERYAAARRRAAEQATSLASFREMYDFGLDPFQVEACQALEAGKGVLVAAPTGSGKTIVGEFAVHLALEQRSEEHTSELQSRRDLVCRLLLEKKKAR